MALRRGGFTAKPNNALTSPPAKAPPSPGGQCSAPENTLRGRGIDGPPQDSPPPKAVEQSAGRRRTIDPSPLPNARKGVATPRPGRY